MECESVETYKKMKNDGYLLRLGTAVLDGGKNDGGYKECHAISEGADRRFIYVFLSPPHPQSYCEAEILLKTILALRLATLTLNQGLSIKPYSYAKASDFCVADAVTHRGLGR